MDADGNRYTLRVRIVPVEPVMLEQRARTFTTRSIKHQAKAAGLRLALSMVDLTTLEGADTPEKVRSLCRKAIDPLSGVSPLGARRPTVTLSSVAAVCIYPAIVRVAKPILAGSPVKLAAVATGFPSGQFPLDIRLADVARAIADGADEIDMVINRGAFLAGRLGEVREEIRQVFLVCRAGGAHLKVILETGELGTYDAIRRASDLAIDACASVGGLADGEVFIKTSTGKVSVNATMPVTLVMLEAIRDHFRATGVRIGMKPAGGIRAAKTALHYLVMVKETLGEGWLTPRLFRFGASSLVNDLLRQIVRLETGRYVSVDDFAEA